MGAQYFIEVVEFETEKVERTLGPFVNERQADRAEDGLNRQLNHERYFTRAVSRHSGGSKL